MDINLKYGCNNIQFKIDHQRVINILKPEEIAGLDDPVAEIEKSLYSPIGSISLLEKLNSKSPEKVIIVVNDITRPTPYSDMLPPLLEVLQKGGIKREQITFVIATGIHQANSEKQNRDIFGDFMMDNYRFISHNCDSPDLVDLGQMSQGNRLLINREVYEADFVITLGVILPHYFAGFSGGRKSILPGVAGRSTIEFNHSRMVSLMDNLPAIQDNPLSQEMIEGAQKVGVDFIVNVVTNSRGEIVKVVSGDLLKAWLEGTRVSSSMYEVKLQEQADVTIVTAGGHPRDINIYQSQKGLDHADRATKKGGTIILLAECPEGLGESTFEEWIKESNKPEDIIDRIKAGFKLGGHKAFGIAKVALKKEIILISSLDEEVTKSLFATKKTDIESAIKYVEEKHGKDYKCIVMPQGGLTVPVFN